ncbi:hypothetical protein NDU88_007751 [Pleurodeles waltl]|uniref:Uncharacterized protein n=1 Tax=Pleurodeles waltl TaxID=8319 RepID=A0AAV7STA4_PLEWA|nr:hypothetical protein NDU88_007751 [Pleurodeles waltl]
MEEEYTVMGEGYDDAGPVQDPVYVRILPSGNYIKLRPIVRDTYHPIPVPRPHEQEQRKSQHLNGQDPVLVQAQGTAALLQKEQKKKLSNKIILLIVLTIAAIIFSLLVWIMEEVFLAKTTVLATVTPAPGLQEHYHFTLPYHEEKYRLAYQISTFIQVLHHSHDAANITRCWVCGKLQALTVCVLRSRDVQGSKTDNDLTRPRLGSLRNQISFQPPSAASPSKITTFPHAENAKQPD